MGHIRLGYLPKTRKWKEVVALIEGGAGTAQLATATINAAEGALNFAVKDHGVVETIWLLTQLPLAARSDDFATALRDRGLPVSDSPGLMEVVGAVSDAVDARLSNCRGRTDLGEMAQMAANETIADVIGGKTNGLFGTTSADVRNAFASLGTVKKFSEFARQFFARFTNKCLDFFLSRTLAHHVGDGRRFTTLAQKADFTKALTTHCQEAAVIVERFSGEWFAKTKWEQGEISREKTAGFVSHAMTKLVSELKLGARPDVH
jgi:hypothetical protein